MHHRSKDDSSKSSSRSRLGVGDKLVAHSIAFDEAGIPELEPTRTLCHDVGQQVGVRLERCCFAVSHGGRGRTFAFFRVAEFVFAYDADLGGGPVARILIGRCKVANLAAANHSFIADDANGLYLFDIGEIRRKPLEENATIPNTTIPDDIIVEPDSPGSVASSIVSPFDSDKSLIASDDLLQQHASQGDE